MVSIVLQCTFSRPVAALNTYSSIDTKGKPIHYTSHKKPENWGQNNKNVHDLQVSKIVGEIHKVM